jgi:hypothetical protein
MLLRLCSNGAIATYGPRALHYWSFTISIRHTAFGRTPVDEWSARPDNTQHFQGTDIQAEFEPVTPSSEMAHTARPPGRAQPCDYTCWSFLLQNSLRALSVCSVAECHGMEANRAIPLRAWTGPLGCRKLGLLGFLYSSAHEGIKLVSLTHRPPLTPRMSLLYLFPLGGIVRPKGLSQPEIPLTSSGTTHDLPGCSAVPQPVSLSRTPRRIELEMKCYAC